MLGRTVATDDRIDRWRRRVLAAVRQARTDSAFVAAARRAEGDGALLARAGWRAIHRGRREQAQRLFRAALHHDPYAVSAWLGLSRAAATQSDRRALLQTALDMHVLVRDEDQRR
jgi:hypothetical protein